jgi:predicted DNA-binding transcriptional regulator AlpA
MDQLQETLLLKSNEAAHKLAISPRTLWQIKQDGKIRCVRINRLVRYDLQDLLAYIEQQKKFSNYQI